MRTDPIVRTDYCADCGGWRTFHKRAKVYPWAWEWIYRFLFGTWRWVGECGHTLRVRATDSTGRAV